MREKGFNVGGEQSGHFLFLDYAPSGDGILSALQVLQVCCETGRPLRDLRQVMRKYPQKLYNVRVREKKPLAQMPAVEAAVRDVEQKLGGHGRLFVRYSGTENILRVLLENSTEQKIEELAKPVLQAIQDTIGA
jgi:phosphoglucosamine mutase